jgi:ABC-type transporter Mla subunit MlaD
MRVKSDRILLEISRSRISFLWLMWLILCGALAGWVVLKNQTFKRPWAHYREVRVIVDDAKGVQAGRHQVRIAGVVVGVVKRTTLDHGHAELTLSIERKYGKLYRDARLRIRPQTPLADMYVAVERRGTPRAGELTTADVLTAEQTVSPVDISRVLNTFNVPTRDRLAALLDGFDRGLGTDGGAQLRAGFVALAPFLHAADRLTSVLARHRAATAQLVHGLSGVTGALAVRDRQLRQLTSAGNAALGELAARDRPLAATLRALPPTLTTLDRSFAAVRTAQRTLDPALTELRPVAARLDDGLSALARFGDDATPAFRALTPSVTQLSPLVRSLGPTAGSLDTALTRLTPQAPRLDRITTKLAGCLYPLQKFLSWSLSVFKFSDAAAAITRADSTIGLDSAGGLVADPGVVHERDCAEGK